MLPGLRSHTLQIPAAMLIALGVALLTAAPVVQAIPASGLRARQAITALEQSQITAFTPYTYYASAGYCPASETLTWTCGANCEANPGFEPVASGGDGDGTQYCKWPDSSWPNCLLTRHKGSSGMIPHWRPSSYHIKEQILRRCG